MRAIRYSSCGRCREGFRPRGRASWIHTLGLVLMLVGGLLLLICVPIQVWLAMIGLLMLALGFFLWRIG